jgi:hypothetical protein
VLEIKMPRGGLRVLGIEEKRDWVGKTKLENMF